MEMIEYFNVMTNTVYDRSFSFLIPGLVLFFVGAALILFFVKKKDIKNRMLKLFFMFLFTVIATVSLFSRLYTFLSSIVELRSLYRDGKYHVVEGPVNNFKPMPLREERRKESFEINGIQFYISYRTETAAYNKRSIDGSPIQEGAYIRLYYVDTIENNIIGLWVRE